MSKLQYAQVNTMSKIKRTARQAKGKAKEAIAEVLGDGKLQEEAKTEQREGEEEDKEPSSLNPFGNLHRLT
ncbi:CsbD family protein [Bradyrhizobium archetypum]|uniref:CsbD family protein n=1 Tax=Bradyrhizobium archetypum TaxID=2721160 RepID=A0A7Y4H1B1_9BRAD|nr:CsbD family protein [Bradyrhizobium archetypum]NOJ45798.1 CsbD family protein [Bradyrhizobium archetypum]